MNNKRRYPIGAEIFPEQGAHFRVWAPDHQEVFLLIENIYGNPKEHKLESEKDGYFSLFVPQVDYGALYSYKLNDQLFPDPASRFQPLGVRGPSCIVDPHFAWTDHNWPGITMKNQVIYEMHLGTFTQEGTFVAATEQLEELASLGITLLELMPLNDFPGHFGWGYDGVCLFAPARLYGTPAEVKSFINKAHELKMGVILDVVYNHLGPEDNQLIFFSKNYLSEVNTDWGNTINFDQPEVREFFLTNVRYWIEEYHFDGLRVDATSCIHSTVSTPILTELTLTCRKAAGEKNIVIIGENEPQDTTLLHSHKENGNGFDALWNDDFHHTAHVRLRGKREAYYTDYLGSNQEFISCAKYGFLYQGQFYEWQKKTRGVADFNLPPESLVIFLENHDQIANSLHGRRLHQLSDLGNYKALACLLLLGPNTPMLFQGQEFGSSKPFFYFADHNVHLGKQIFNGRIKFLNQFPRLSTQEAEEKVPDPSNPLTFTQCKLDFREREKNKYLYDFYRDLIQIRRKDPIFQKMQEIRIDGAVLGTDSFLLRYFGKELGDRLLIINFGPDHYFNPAPEPLLVAGVGLEWEILWSSESPTYLGEGTPPINIPYWKILGHSAIALKTKERLS